jgi:hypothetical protein
MSGYESPSPEEEVTGESDGDATGGGSPGNPDDMGAEDGLTVEEGAGRTGTVDDNEAGMAE